MTAIHPTAVVHPEAQLGEGTRIGPHAVVEESTVLGTGCVLEAGAVVKSHTRLGRDNHLFEGAVLGGPPQDLAYTGEVTRLEVGDGNTFREGATIHRATGAGSATVIGSGGYFMAGSHVGHDCHVGDGVILANNVALAGHVTVEDRVVFGGGAQVHQFCRVGTLAMVGGAAAVSRDVLPFSLVAGYPARTVGINRVALRKAGLSQPEMGALRRALRRLLDPGTPLAERLLELEGDRSDKVQYLVRFARESRRGLTARRRGAQRGQEGGE